MPSFPFSDCFAAPFIWNISAACWGGSELVLEPLQCRNRLHSTIYTRQLYCSRCILFRLLSPFFVDQCCHSVQQWHMAIVTAVGPLHNFCLSSLAMIERIFSVVQLKNLVPIPFFGPWKSKMNKKANASIWFPLFRKIALTCLYPMYPFRHLPAPKPLLALLSNRNS